MARGKRGRGRKRQIRQQGVFHQIVRGRKRKRQPKKVGEEMGQIREEEGMYWD